MNFRRVLVAVLMLFALTACKTDLYTKLTEQEANTMLSLLLENGISASKVSAGDGLVTLQVDEADLQQAVTVLNANGLPKRTRDTLGKVFQKSGIISSPFEERIRFVYALSEEVAATITEIDGIVSARVHIVLPEKAELGEEIKPSSAAIFIKHRPEFDIEFLIPQIKRLASNAIEGVEYANVSVALVPARDLGRPKAQNSQMVSVIPGLRVSQGDSAVFWQLIIGVGVLLLVLIGAVIFLVIKVMGVRGKQAEQAQGEEPLSEELA
ncbi:type III secretion system inner membrane ring lipoprotein SctJ [Polycladidibacter hongkongensis]|uniref:type III secretion system inner membrane ring lipoprotein SctJ n=1 Tax=Polycladidibacter hongkongensis TaxID=1647556 RepID=UPI00083778EE|nr:type III secretion inner membrane ring lipoprotein SctJ [Pseudovibrio hongkongensis]